MNLVIVIIITLILLLSLLLWFLTVNTFCELESLFRNFRQPMICDFICWTIFTNVNFLLQGSYGEAKAIDSQLNIVITSQISLQL